MVTEAEQEHVFNEPEKKIEQLPFFHTARKVLLAGIGAAALAQDEAEEFINRLIERGEIAEKDGRSLMHEVIEKRKGRFSKLEDQATKRIEKALKRMNLPTKTDLDALSEKVAALSQKIDELKHE